MRPETAGSDLHRHMGILQARRDAGRRGNRAERSKFVLAGLGDGAQPLAVTMNEGVALIDRPAHGGRRLRMRYVMRSTSKTPWARAGRQGSPEP